MASELVLTLNGGAPVTVIVAPTVAAPTDGAPGEVMVTEQLLGPTLRLKVFTDRLTVAGVELGLANADSQEQLVPTAIGTPLLGLVLVTVMVCPPGGTRPMV